MLLGPILITMGKEDKELLGIIVPLVDAEIEELHKNGVVIEDKEEMHELKIRFLRSMNDGKMQKLLVGRGGAFCILCSFSCDDAVLVEQIKEGLKWMMSILIV